MSFPSFEDAVVALQQFLRDQRLPEDIRWIFRGDLIRMPALAVRSPLPPLNEAVARVYERARARGLGVALHAVCLIGTGVGAIVEVPEDEQDASQRMFFEDGLKLSIATNMQVAVEIGTRIEWLLRVLLQPSWDSIPPRPSTRLAAARVM